MYFRFFSPALQSGCVVWSLVCLRDTVAGEEAAKAYSGTLLYLPNSIPNLRRDPLRRSSSSRFVLSMRRQQYCRRRNTSAAVVVVVAAVVDGIAPVDMASDADSFDLHDPTTRRADSSRVDSSNCDALPPANKSKSRNQQRESFQPDEIKETYDCLGSGSFNKMPLMSVNSFLELKQKRIG